MADWFDATLSEATKNPVPKPKPTKAPKRTSAAARPPRKVEQYSAAVRREAIRLVTDEGYNYKRAADALGVDKVDVERWVRNHLIDKGVLVADYEPEPQDEVGDGA